MARPVFYRGSLELQSDDVEKKATSMYKNFFVL